MSYKSEFASNNADLQTILDVVNGLPDDTRVNVEITGSTTVGYVTIGGVNYSSAASVKVNVGDTITLVYSGTSMMGSVIIDGVSDYISKNSPRDYVVSEGVVKISIALGSSPVITLTASDTDTSTESTFTPTDSGGTTYKSKFADNNVDLQKMLDAINALSKTISFTIYGTTFQAEEGMTWAEWCESSYNTAYFVVRNGHVQCEGGDWDGAGLANSSGNQVSSSAVIEANHAYGLI